VSFLLSWSIVLVGALLVGLALYLVWFPLPTLTLDRTALSISSVVGVIMLMAGGSLLLKSPRRSRTIEDHE
jgi:hypothetical protein